MSSIIADVDPPANAARGAPPYRAPLWLPGGHVQTIYASLFAPRHQVIYQRERWDTAPNGVDRKSVV